MRMLIFLMIGWILLLKPHSALGADPAYGDSKEGERINQNFIEELDSLKNPFHSPIPALTAQRRMNELQKNKQAQEAGNVKPVEEENPSPVQNPQPPVAPPKFILSGIIWESPRPQAIINDQIVGIGDVIDHWTVIAIDEGGIKVALGETTFLIADDLHGLADPVSQ